MVKMPSLFNTSTYLSTFRTSRTRSTRWTSLESQRRRRFSACRSPSPWWSSSSSCRTAPSSDICPASFSASATSWNPGLRTSATQRARRWSRSRVLWDRDSSRTFCLSCAGVCGEATSVTCCATRFSCCWSTWREACDPETSTSASPVYNRYRFMLLF